MLAALTATGCASADAAASSKTTRKKAVRTATTRRTTKPRTTSTTRPPTTRSTATTTSTPKLSAAAQQVLDGYEAYLGAYVAGSREPERARELYPKGMTGDALARLIDLADFDVSQGQYWDGTRADIVSKARVQSVGETRAAIRDCRSVGGVVRKKGSNEPVAGTTSADVDDLIVDLVKIDGRWVVTRTDRTNAEEGKATCTPGSSP